ncbi:hypothetical protein [Demequina mangrovi]|uniref:Uncharacterized protein n=1 Tax=Demequina mangrovi TaxID=1043493 RepID=A0A1H6WDS3_9MICO|nr:hypothetical protein [Demequina mangrovi]SEJ10465.1 hypothetical protein SAMN05421637_0786 [Demequina mangrovi]
MTGSTLKAALLAAAAAMGLAVAMAAPASARTDVDRYEFPIGRFYDNLIAPTAGITPFEQELVAVVGMSASQYCAGESPELSDELDRISADGALVHERFVTQRATMEVYDGGGLGILDYLDTVHCPALAAGVAPDPVGVGTANLKDKATVDFSAFPVVTIEAVNGANGTVVTPTGERLAVATHSEVEVYIELDPATGEPVVVEEVPLAMSVSVLNRR